MSGLLHRQLTSSMPTSLSVVQLRTNQRPTNERLQHTHRVLDVEAQLGLGAGQHHLCQMAQVAHRLAVELVHLAGGRGGWGGSIEMAAFRWTHSDRGLGNVCLAEDRLTAELVHLGAGAVPLGSHA